MAGDFVDGRRRKLNFSMSRRPDKRSTIGNVINTYVKHGVCDYANEIPLLKYAKNTRIC